MGEEKRSVWKMNWNSILKILFVVFVVICLGTIVHMNSTIKNMQQELSQIRQDVLQMNGSVSSQISGITANLEASLKKENSLLSDYSYQVQVDQIKRKEKIIPMVVTVRPKVHKEGLKTTITAETDEGKIISVPGVEGEGFTYSAQIEPPYSHNLKLSVSFDDGSVQKSEVMEEIHEPFDIYFMKVGIWRNH